MMLKQAEALEQLKLDNTNSKLEALEELHHLVREPETLKYAGYRSIEDAANTIVKRVFAECEARIRKFERDYPDDEDWRFD